MGWDVEIGDEFEPDFKGLPEDVRTEILAHARLGSEKRFYKQFIAKADDRFDAHLARLKKKERK